MFDSFDPRWSDARDRNADRELDREIYRDTRERGDDPRDALLNDAIKTARRAGVLVRNP